MNKLPKIGEIYDCYDDGKIRDSRRYSVKIKGIIPFYQANNDIISEWRQAVDTYNWLFDRETDYFIIADSYEIPSEITQSIFVRTINKGWFSIGDLLNSGRLDLDGDMICKV